MTPVMVPCQNHYLPTAGNVVAAAIHRLQESLSTSIHQRVQVDYRAGVLILQGRAKSYYHKQLIQEALRDLDGVEDILNSVEVTDSVG